MNNSSIYAKGLIIKINSRGHCLKSVRIRIYSGPYFPAFRQWDMKQDWCAWD